MSAAICRHQKATCRSVTARAAPPYQSRLTSCASPVAPIPVMPVVIRPVSAVISRAAPMQRRIVRPRSDEAPISRNPVPRDHPPRLVQPQPMRADQPRHPRLQPVLRIGAPLPPPEMRLRPEIRRAGWRAAERERDQVIWTVDSVAYEAMVNNTYRALVDLWISDPQE